MRCSLAHRLLTKSFILTEDTYMSTRHKDLSIEERIKKLEAVIDRLSMSAAQEAKPSFITNLLQGVTLLSIVAFAFWFGTLNGKVDQATIKVDTLTSAISGATKDSLSSRLTAVETKLDSIDKTLASIDSKLDKK